MGFKKNQQGLAAIIVVTVIIALLTIITVGFAALMDREYRQSTDNELATQAEYAAESGMNDARAYIYKEISSGVDPDNIGMGGKQCINLTYPYAPFPLLQDGSISGSYNNPSNPSTDNLVKYTCVLINTQPSDLTFQPTSNGTPIVFEVANPTTTFNNLYFSWENTNSTNGGKDSAPLGSSTSSLPEENSITNPNVTGMLRVTIYPAINGAPNTDQAVTTASRTYFFYPLAVGSAGSPGSVPYSNNSAQGMVSSECNDNNVGPNSFLPYTSAGGYYCNEEITGMPKGFYYVSISAIYQDLNVGVQGSDTNGNPVKFSSSQAMVDVTAEGNDILKRIEGRVSLTQDYNWPSYTLQSMDTICKRLRLPVNASNSYGASSIVDPPSGNGTGLDGLACQPQ